ncbi:hypothetical protein SAMN05421827_111201 [Pedobacter terrae]|uniref:Uncharacterized protein n=1 Tax=Pedobacter terrae TaxID=405671 RepID=A0A1G7XG67_9SPHI|nr:hypothetical protein [Pedobacter terrae]SDG83116.1 hypothetical protein SAMN05421827_111201 [Pedobacter terrae]
MNRFQNFVNWENTAHFATLLSVVVAGWALYISTIQFRTSIKKTDEQIMIMKEERRRGQEENRQYIVIDSIQMESDPERYPGDTTKYWNYTINLKNSGIRPAVELKIYNKVLGRISNKIDFEGEDTYRNYRISTVDTIELDNPLASERTENTTVFPRYRKFDRFLAKITISYKDVILDTVFNESYHYSNTRFDVLRDGKEITWLGMTGLTKKETKILTH